MRTITTAALAALTAAGLATAGMASANAYVVDGSGNYTVTADELQTAFGAEVDLTAVTFSAAGGNTVYLVTCQKAVGKKGKVIRRDFKRQDKVTWSVDDSAVTTEGVITGFSVTTTAASTSMAKVRCPKPFTLEGTPTPFRVTDIELSATYDGSTVELMDSTS